MQRQVKLKGGQRVRLVCVSRRPLPPPQRLRANYLLYSSMLVESELKCEFMYVIIVVHIII